MRDKVYSLDEEYFRNEGLYELIADHDLQDGDVVYVGDASHVNPLDLFDANDLVDHLADRMYDNVGECSDGWPFVDKDVLAEVNKDLEALIEKHFPNNFYKVLNVQEYCITKGDMEQ